MYDSVKAAIQPYLFLLLVQAVLILGIMRRSRTTRRLAATLLVTWLILVVLSLPLVGRLMMATLEWSYPPPVLPAHVDVLVVMGGGVNPPDAYRTKASVSGSSYARCVHAAGLYQRYRSPVILCGGATEDQETDVSEAEVLADAMAFLGVERADMLLEKTSLSTRQNAVQATQIIRERGFRDVLLVTHARHMPRADLCFRKLGVQVIPAPCGANSARLWQTFDETWIPSSGALGDANWVFHEWVGLLYYRCRGWI